MTEPIERSVVFGDTFVAARFPDETQLVSPGLTLPLDPAPDLETCVRSAIERPLDTPPLREQVRAGDKVTVAFDDPTVPCYAPVWATALPVVVADLERGGVRTSDISLVCANALHRKFSHDELARTIGSDVVAAHADRLACHDPRTQTTSCTSARRPPGSTSS